MQKKERFVISVYFDRESNRFEGLTNEVMQTLRKTFPDVNIDTELSMMSVWLMTTPKAKTYKGTMPFITRWLNNCKTSKQCQASSQGVSTEIESILEEYLKDLWKNREHILQMNTF